MTFAREIRRKFTWTMAAALLVLPALSARAEAPSIYDTIGRVMGFLGAPSTGTQLSGSVSANGSGPCGYSFSLASLGYGESQARVKVDAGRTLPEGTFEHLTADFGSSTRAQVLEYSESETQLHLAVGYFEDHLTQHGRVLESHPMKVNLDLQRQSDGRIDARIEKRSTTGWSSGFKLHCILPSAS